MSINTKSYLENYIKIIDKAGNVISLKLNEPQLKYYNVIKRMHEQRIPIRIIILKARQMGFSTETEAIIFKNVVTHHNYNAGIVAHKEESTANIFSMSKRMLDYLPTEIKPEQKKSNAKELVFNNEKGTGLDSKIKCMTAGGNGIGRSDTFTALHLSEVAFWQGDKKKTMTGLLQAVPNTPESMIIIESTANGYEYFKEMWDKAVSGENDFYPLFIGWNELKEYSMPYTGFTLTKEENELQKIYNLTLEQLTWRRWCIQNNCSGDVELFKQEYPICPEEAFISTGTCIFDKQAIINRIQKLKEPVKQGYFTYDTYYDSDKNEVLIKDETIKWIDDEKGYIKIYKDVNQGYPYVIGGDTAGEGSDNFTGQVLDNTTGEQVAVLKHKFDEDMYAKQMYCLGYYYNRALIGIETNYSTYPNKELERLEYPNLYVREKEDTYTHNIVKAYGFETNKKTRPVIIAGLIEFTRENIDLINDKDTLREMLVFVRNEKGRAEAQQGSHDDLVMGKAIAHYIRPQQDYLVKSKEKEQKKKYNPLDHLYDNEKEEQSDYGMTIKVI